MTVKNNYSVGKDGQKFHFAGSIRSELCPAQNERSVCLVVFSSPRLDACLYFTDAVPGKEQKDIR